MSVARSVGLVVLVAALGLVGEVGMTLVVPSMQPECASLYSVRCSAEAAATAELDFATCFVVGEFAIVRGETASVLGERATVGVDASFVLTCN